MSMTPSERRAKQRARYAQWLAVNRDKNNLVRRTRYKHDPAYKARCLEQAAKHREQKKLAAKLG